MSEHDISLVTTKSATTIIENNTVSLATPSGGLTPSTITAMVGISQGLALQLAPDVQSVMSALAATAASNSSANVAAATALTNLTTLQNKILPSGNHAAFGAFLQQAHTHIGDAHDLNNTSNFVGNLNFSDFGSGITNMSSMVDHGLTGTFGSLSGAGAALSSTGSMFNGISAKNIGSPAGMVQALTNNKLANATGVNQKLVDAGVDLNDIENPVYTDQISQVLGSINDPSVLATVTGQFGQTPHGIVQNLGDLGNPKKLADPSQLAGLTASTSSIATKFSDMGANFPSISSATAMLSKISLPSIPSLDSFAPSLNSLMASHASTLNSLTGASLGTALSPNLGPNGLPSVTDFTQGVAGGPAFTNILNGGVTTDTIAALEASTSKATSLFSTAGVDLTSPPPAGLGSAKNFATSLHKFGTNSEISGLLGNMAMPNTPYGDSIKASLAEGRNLNLLQQNGIQPLSFNSLPNYTGTDSSLSTNAGAKLLGG